MGSPRATIAIIRLQIFSPFCLTDQTALAKRTKLK